MTRVDEQTKKDELSTKPKAMLVHDPSVSGVLERVNRDNHLELLFPLPPNADKAVAEHKELRNLLADQDIKVVELFDLLGEADKATLSENPNIIFTRDPLITLPWEPELAIIGRMSKKARANEPTIYRRIVDSLGLSQVLSPPESVHLEGGDVIPVGLNGKRIILVRTGDRSSSTAVDFLLDSKLNLCDAVLEIQCDDKSLHLDSVMGLCGKNLVVCDRKSIEKGILHDRASSRPMSVEDCLTIAGMEIIPVSFDEADRLQATNFINIGPDTIIAYSGCQRIIKELEKRRVRVLSFDGHELAKGRGGPRCLTRPIY